jgi:uncharacterized protein YbjQ (UPF0145 family)
MPMVAAKRPGGKEEMIMLTTDAVEGRRILRHLGIVTGEAVIGGNAARDLVSGLVAALQKRETSRQTPMKRGKAQALTDMARMAEGLGADAVVGVQMQFQTLANRMLLVNVTGTAVVLEDRVGANSA